ncbi:MAG: hypothetical protein HC908_03460 [Calothrix sp. SM1_7_51]|nr:hypothetical protein [Calothrix sp. SM1_7_51]
MLIVTSDDSVNIKTAIAVRRVTQEVNNNVRLVIHSADKKLNDCLKEALENFVAYDAAELPAEAIANRALGDENRGFFNLGKHRLQMLKIKDWKFKSVLSFV